MNEKKNDDESVFTIAKGYLKDTFDNAKKQTGESLDVISRELRETIKAGEKAGHDAYRYVENTVGKDRVVGAVVGGKVGGLIGMRAGVPGMLIGGAVGTVAGFAGGRAFLKWYRRDESNDNPPMI